MSDKKYSFRNEIKYENQKHLEEHAFRHRKRNCIGLLTSALLFFGLLLATLNGYRLYANLSLLLIVLSMTGVFYFGRELRVLPQGQLIFSAVKAAICLGMVGVYVLKHRGVWDAADFAIPAVLTAVVLIDIPRVIKACRAMKQ